MHIFNYKKSILKNPKISETVFFLLIAFQILKKSILTNLKIPETVFLLIAFSNTKKAHLRI